MTVRVYLHFDDPYEETGDGRWEVAGPFTNPQDISEISDELWWEYTQAKDRLEATARKIELAGAASPERKAWLERKWEDERRAALAAEEHRKTEREVRRMLRETEKIRALGLGLPAWAIEQDGE